jgi:hypothetical protein
MKVIIRYRLFIIAFILVISCEKEEPLVIINDSNLHNALIELGIDTDGDGKISYTEA